MPEKVNPDEKRKRELLKKIKGGENLVSQKELSILLGVSSPRVNQLKNATPSPLIFDGKKIKYAETLALLNARSAIDAVNRPNRKTGRPETSDPGARAEAGKGEIVTSRGEGSAGLEPTGDRHTIDEIGGMNVAALSLVAIQGKALKEYFGGLKDEQEYRVREGELIERGQVTERAFKAARTLRERIGAVPKRLAPILAATDDQFEVYRLLEVELKEALAEIVEELSNNE